jgi:sulfide:quinone oxidoreductase
MMIMPDIQKTKKILILGGGFAGVQAAIRLKEHKHFDVTLVSDRDYLFLYPTSIWIPTRAVDFEQTKVDLREIQCAHGFHLVVDTVMEIRSRENTVACRGRQLSYDYLIIALGAEKVIHVGHEHAFSICGKPEATLKLRDRLDQLIAQGRGKIAIGFGGNPKDSSAVRGGPAFEFIFNLHHHLKKRGVRDSFELTFFAPMQEPGARMGKQALVLIDKMFTSCGIQTRYGKKIKSFDERGVTFEDDSLLQSDCTMFIPGTAGHSVLANSDVPLNEAGFVKIDDHGLVEGTASVYAVGDVAALEGPAWRAKQGHTAEIMADNAVFNIVNAESGSPERRGYRKHLSILCIMDTGNGAAFVYRDEKYNIVLPLPIVGHWLKRAWGWYAKMTKKGKFPHLPGL